MGLKRVRPSTEPPSTAPPASFSSSSSSGSGSGATSGSSSTTNDVDAWSTSASAYDGFGSQSWSSSSSSSSSSNDGDATIDPIDLLPEELRPIVDVPRPDSDIPWTSSSETCYYNRLSEDGCFYPRSCRDCLEMKGCMLNQLGQCVSQAYDHYNGFMDFELAIENNMTGPDAANPNASLTQMYHFPAKVTPYCPVNEPTCTLCKRTDFKEAIDSRFCIGRYQKKSCLCVSICESPLRDGLLVHRNCTDPLDSNTAAKELTHPLMSTPSMFTLVVAPIVLMFVTYRVWKRQRRGRTGSDETVEAGREDDHDDSNDYDATDSVWSWSTATTTMDAQPERVHPHACLELAGWQAQRQEMIEKEHMLLSGMDDPSIGDRFVGFDAEDGDRCYSSEDSSLFNSPPEDSRVAGVASPPIPEDELRRRVYWDESELSML